MRPAPMMADAPRAELGVTRDNGSLAGVVHQDDGHIEFDGECAELCNDRAERGIVVFCGGMKLGERIRDQQDRP